MSTTNKKKWDFKEQLAIGNAGEQLFMQHYHGPKLELHPGRDGDFICTKSGSKLELKSDRYDPSVTANFFIERYSDGAKKSPGSLWQAHQHGCDIFVYMYKNHNTYFEFKDIPKVCQLIDRYIEEKKLSYVGIPNRAWTTIGYKIPRSILAEHYEEYSW